jgi:hypothetical protein
LQCLSKTGTEVCSRYPGSVGCVDQKVLKLQWLQSTANTKEIVPATKNVLKYNSVEQKMVFVKTVRNYLNLMEPGRLLTFLKEPSTNPDTLYLEHTF